MNFGLRQRIQRDLQVKSHIEPAEEIAQRIAFLVKTLQKSRLQTLILGISGGQDSTLAGRLCQLAVEQCRQQNYSARFLALCLPYHRQLDQADVEIALRFIKPDCSFTIDIQPPSDSATEMVEYALAQAKIEPFTLSNFVKGNIKARQRMVVQYAISGHLQGLVVGTDHAAEAVTGFFTKYGDGGVDITPLAGLTKRQGAALLKQLHAPLSTWQKVPVADLEDDKLGFPDEQALGLTYQQIDDYLENQPIDETVAKKIEQMYLATQHKRRLPVTPFDD